MRYAVTISMTCFTFGETPKPQAARIRQNQLRCAHSGAAPGVLLREYHIGDPFVPRCNALWSWGAEESPKAALMRSSGWWQLHYQPQVVPRVQASSADRLVQRPSSR